MHLISALIVLHEWMNLCVFLKLSLFFDHCSSSLFKKTSEQQRRRAGWRTLPSRMYTPYVRRFSKKKKLLSNTLSLSLCFISFFYYVRFMGVIAFGNVEVGNGCEGWRWVRGMPLDMMCGVGQGGACFANSLMGRCSRLP